MLAMLVTGCGPQPEAPSEDDGRLLVMASIAPLGSFAAHVGGDRVQVEIIVPPGSSPHTFEPKPAQLKGLSEAAALVLNGLGIEPWADKLVEAAQNPELVVVRTAEGMELLQTGEHGGGNPHVWLDPIRAIEQVKRITAALEEADPDGADVYQVNAEDFIAQLRQLHEDIAAAVQRFRSRRFVAQHAAWAYFAERYGLVEAAVIEESPGREPSPAEIAELVEAVARTRARVIFAEPQLSPKAAEAIAAESGAEVLLLDPLGRPPDYDYLETMRYNLKQLKQGLG